MERSTFDIQPGIGGHRKTCQPISRKATMQSMLAFVHDANPGTHCRVGRVSPSPSLPQPGKSPKLHSLSLSISRDNATTPFLLPNQTLHPHIVNLQGEDSREFLTLWLFESFWTCIHHFHYFYYFFLTKIKKISLWNRRVEGRPSFFRKLGEGRLLKSLERVDSKLDTHGRSWLGARRGKREKRGGERRGRQDACGRRCGVPWHGWLPESADS